MEANNLESEQSDEINPELSTVLVLQHGVRLKIPFCRVYIQRYTIDGVCIVSPNTSAERTLNTMQRRRRRLVRRSGITSKTPHLGCAPYIK
jgi:hypothetical protein